MNLKCCASVFLWVACIYHQNVTGQANTSLSNLANPTAANRDLLPGTNNTLNLGSGTRHWKNIYMGTNLYLENLLTIHAPGTFNFYVGPSAGNPVAIGTNNTGLGYFALSSNTSGSSNIAIGLGTLQSNTSGARNTAIGHAALYYNTTGGYNASVGTRALFLNISGVGNTAMGDAALYTNASGVFNSAFGLRSLFSNTTGDYNSAHGYYALYSNTTGSNNTAVGNQALYSNTSGQFNTAIGNNTLINNTLGSYNTANGTRALFYNTTGGWNTAIGDQALYNNTTGASNIAIGFAAGYTATSNSTFVGTGANALVEGLVNATAIGYLAYASGNNQVRIGNTNVVSIGGYAGWTTFSDGRYKKDVKEDVPGLAFINELKPVTYTIHTETIHKENFLRLSKSVRNMDERILQSSQIQSAGAKPMKIYTGFIAQEVEQAAKKLKYEFSGVDAPKNDQDYYGLRYAEFVVPLVKAVQELSKQNEVLKEKIDQLEAMINGKTSKSAELFGLSLGQNNPNPFKISTVINYSLPNNLTAAQLVIYDANGKALKQINISGKGKGVVNLNAASLAAGGYYYSLFVDGRLIDTKNMLLLK